MSKILEINITSGYSFNRTQDLDRQLYVQAFSKLNLFILIFFGILGNICCMFVFLQKNMRKRKIHWYLLVLATFELLFSLMLSIDYLYKMFHKDSVFLHDLNVYTNMIIDYSIHLIDAYVTILTLILSIDRLYAIKHLPDQRNFITHKHAKCLISIAFISILVLKIPILILCYENTERCFNIVTCTIVSPLIFNILPTIGILVVNSILVYRLIDFYRKLSMERRLMISSRIQSREQSELNLKVCKRKSNKNIVINVYKLTIYPLCRTQKVQFVVIIVTATWSVLQTLLYYPLTMFHFYVYRYKIIIDIDVLTKYQIVSSFFFNLNHCIHFFIYFSFNFEFRKCLFKFFKHKR